MLLIGAVSAIAVMLGLFAAMGASASGEAPGAETEKAVEITKHEAILEATVNPHGSETECEFQYGTTKGTLNKVVPCGFKPGHQTIRVPENANLTGLTESTTYYFRIHATNEHGENNGEEHQFTTLPAPPKANTEPAREVKRTTATLVGDVTPNGSVTECYFLWGPEKEGPLPNRANCTEPNVAAGEEPSSEVEVAAHISGLTESHTYYYRLIAVNAQGEDVGGKNHFQALPAAPHTHNLGAKGVTETEAEFRGEVTPNDAKVTSCEFKYGLEKGELNKSVPCASFGVGSGEAPETVTAQVSGLEKGTHYTYVVVASNANGSDESGGQPFHTLPAGPKVEMHHAYNVTATGATLSAAVDPEGAPTVCYFEYGTTPALGGIAPCETSPGSGYEFEKVSAKITGLTANTTYLVRIEAFNEQGSDRGGEHEHHNFTTAKGGEPPTVTKIKPKSGPSQGGNTVTVVGLHYEEVTAVYFGGTEGTVTKVEAGNEKNPGKITVTAPPGVGKVDITVVTSNGTSAISKNDEYTYKKPTITSITPAEGSVNGGTEVVVTGSGFELGNHGTQFIFGKAASTSVECETSTSCVVITPSAPVKHSELQAGKVNVVAIVNHTGKSKKSSFTYTN